MPSISQVLEYVDRVLYAHGPEALPYAHGAKYAIGEHVAELVKVNLGSTANKAHVRALYPSGWRFMQPACSATCIA